MARRILILGGTTEARLLAERLADRPGLDVTVSLAGRTAEIVDHPVPVRVGGFGGVDGLAAYLRAQLVDALIDATHPYAEGIAANAAAAARTTGVAFVALKRAAWQQQPGDRWTEVADVDEAIAALGDTPRRVFLALGRQEIAPFVRAPQHAYLIRSIDPVDPPLALPHAAYVVARGPFDAAAEEGMLRELRIDTIVCRNSGGSAASGKIAAARNIGIEVVMLRRPVLADAPTLATVTEALAWLDHADGSSTERGV